MDRAVQAKWENPDMSTELALRIGGFDYPPLESVSGVTQKELVDSEGRSITQRKNNLLRRLRHLRQWYGDNRNVSQGGGEEGEGADIEDGVSEV